MHPPQTAVLGNSRPQRRIRHTPWWGREAQYDGEWPCAHTAANLSHLGTKLNSARFCLLCLCWDASCNRKPARVALGRTDGWDHTHPYSCTVLIIIPTITHPWPGTVLSVPSILHVFRIHFPVMLYQHESDTESGNRPMSPVGSVDIKSL